MNAFSQTRIGPSDLSEAQMRSLLEVVEGGAQPVLIGRDGERIELPPAFNDLFVTLIEAMKRKEAVFLTHENEAFTTQAAANYLGISRQFLVRLLDAGEIPFHHVGSHRRLFFRDLVQYQQERSRRRRLKLDEMTDEVVAAGLDDVVVDLSRPE